MEIDEVKQILRNNGFEVRDVEYSTDELRNKYGLSFEGVYKKGDGTMIKINNVECYCSRIIEEFGSIVSIWNGNQIQIKIEDINKFEVL